jgi:uncharacterized protein
MRGIISRDRALEILKENNCPQNVVKHCLLVSKEAKRIAEKIKAKGIPVEVDFVETAALLHDIGRSRTHGIKHGIEGAKILHDYPRYARVCERHIGAGITKDEAEKLGLPAEDYQLKTLEEKIVCYADKLFDGDKKITLKESLGKYEKRLGKQHPTIERIKRLNKGIIRLIMGNK